MLKTTKLVFIFCSIFLIENAIFAATPAQTGLSLYDQPDAKRKIVATIPTGQALIPIFNQGDWIKVGDPTNGNVGWVNKSALSAQGYPTLYVKTYGDKNKNGDMQSYQIMQYPGAEAMDQKQMDSMLKNFQAQQATLEKQMNQLMQQNLNDFNQLWARPMVIPILQPIILVPEKAQSKPNEKKWG